jgi:pimeloyl-ACP methyl ester carboxylesterase
MADAVGGAGETEALGDGQLRRAEDRRPRQDEDPGTDVVSDRIDVDVPGGALATFRLGDGDGPPVLAIHGITSSSRSWCAVARALAGRATLIAPDLRGRGRSNELPEPYGIGVHAADMAAALLHHGVQNALVVGHSLGAYIAAQLALDRPDLVRAVLLVDGGLRIPGSEGADPQRFLEAFLGPALARLRMTFPSCDAYQRWWRAHPAIAGGDVDPDDLAAYANHDLIGVPPELRPAVAAQAVRADGADLFTIGDAARALELPATLLCAPRGLLDDPHPMQPLELCREWAAQAPELRTAFQVDDVNHYTIVLGRRGAAAVSDAILAVL